jgi:NAD+ synthase
MPIHQEPSQIKRSSSHIAWLKENFSNVSSLKLDLTSSFDTLIGELDPQGKDDKSNFLAQANTRSRMRMSAIYYYANKLSYLVAGTGNKVEDFGIGFFTKGGDQIVDISPIASITKTQVYEVATYLGINKEIIGAPPTDGLWGDSRTDEQQIGASYPELERAMHFVESINGGSMPKEEDIENIRDLALSNPVDVRIKVVINILMDRYKANQHKMNPIPVFDYFNA